MRTVVLITAWDEVAFGSAPMEPSPYSHPNPNFYICQRENVNTSHGCDKDIEVNIDRL